MATCLLCTRVVEDSEACSRLWVQANPSVKATDLGYYAHPECCTRTYGSTIKGEPTVHFSTASLNPTPSIFEVVVPGPRKQQQQQSVPPVVVVLYPIQHHTDTSRPPCLHSKQCLRDL